jgi:hypothetical protein
MGNSLAGSSPVKHIPHRSLVLRRMFAPKRDEVTGEWRKMHNEELHYLYSSPNIIRQNK